MSDDRNISILLLGPESCGKTLLLKSLQHYSRSGGVWDSGSIPKHGRPTLGVELATFPFPVHSSQSNIQKSAGKKQNGLSITVRELGGQMAPLWPSYLRANHCEGLMYCVDSLNPFQASGAAVELAGLLNNSTLRETVKRILVVFTKSADFANVDSEAKPDVMSIVELRNLMLLDDILDEFRRCFQSIDVVTECSAVTGVGLRDIFQWMNRIATH